MGSYRAGGGGGGGADKLIDRHGEWNGSGISRSGNKARDRRPKATLKKSVQLVVIIVASREAAIFFFFVFFFLLYRNDVENGEQKRKNLQNVGKKCNSPLIS